MRAFVVLLLTVTLAFLLAIPLSGYHFTGPKWPSPATSMYISIGSPWDGAFITAMSLWNQSTVFKFTTVSESWDPCTSPNSSSRHNGVKFSATICGDEFGSTTLAVASTWSTSTTVTQSGVIFNSKWSWNVYDGPWSTGTWSGVKDFRRVALHELGHVMGLDHEDSVPAIMATMITGGSAIATPQADDIAGVNALYASTGPGDTTSPSLTITSHTNNQVVTTSSITVSGTASDGGRGDNGISSVTVNNVRGNGDTATVAGTANWNRSVTLSPGSNTITVAARDGSSNQNATTQAIAITYNPPTPVTTSPTSRMYHVFPQYADGRMSDGRYFRSTLMISNPSGAAGANCTFRLYGLTVDGFSLFTYNLAAGGWAITPSSAAQTLKSGYATLDCSASVEAQLLYSFYTQDGAKISEATVFSSPTGSMVQILGDSRESARLGVAVANDSDQSVNYTLSAYNNAGSLVGTANFTLAARTNRAQYLDDFFPVPVPAGTYGPVIVSSSSGTASLIGLRFTGDVFTTIPETIRSATASTAAPYHVFPQFADGLLGDGAYFRTTLMISNPSSSAGANCTFQMYGLSIDGASAFTYALAPSGWTISPMGSNQNLKSGYATLLCSASVEAQLLYSFYSQNGSKISEATVFSSPPSAVTQVLADSRESARLGLAIANDSALSASYTVSAYDQNGAQLGTTTVTLDPRTNLAKFLDELLTNLPSGHYGQVFVSSTSGTASIIGLRFTGGIFTTIPETLR